MSANLSQLTITTNEKIVPDFRYYLMPYMTRKKVTWT